MPLLIRELVTLDVLIESNAFSQSINAQHSGCICKSTRVPYVYGQLYCNPYENRLAMTGMRCQAVTNDFRKYLIFLYATVMRLIGRQLFSSSLSPFVCTSIINALFYEVGIHFLFKSSEYSFTSTAMISSVANFSKSTDIPSSPLFIDFNVWATSEGNWQFFVRSDVNVNAIILVSWRQTFSTTYFKNFLTVLNSHSFRPQGYYLIFSNIGFV